jgi:hypothetical protein
LITWQASAHVTVIVIISLEVPDKVWIRPRIVFIMAAVL